MDFDHIVWKTGIISYFEKLSACFLLDTAAGYFDIKQFYNIQSAYDCQLACQNEPQCKLIVYDAPITFCYLKTGVRTPTYYQSGMILSPAFCEGNLLHVNFLCWSRNFVHSDLCWSQKSPDLHLTLWYNNWKKITILKWSNSHFIWH